tara:strand:- start:134 stop:832 length:699 start_codon:yes stop_codon:yes gene_type:complete
MNIRLYHPNSIVENTTALLSKEHAHYVVNVMRLKRGSGINFFNKDGEWKSEIVFLDKERVEVKFLKRIKKASNLSKIELAICLVKKNPMEIILQKATELGVSKIIPIISERTEIKDLNYSRANKIIIEATEQSNQFNIPKLEQVNKLKEFISSLSDDDIVLFANINSNKKIDFKNLDKKKRIIVLIGPEGDFSTKEIELILSKKNILSFSLSKNILRTETAVITALSIINYF